MTQPIPVAVGLPSGVTLRGHEWPVDGRPIVLVHDLGEDLDVWGTVPSLLAKSGFRVVSMELRGHGLSDGVPTPTLLVDDVRELVHELSREFGPVALVCHGIVAATAFHVSSDDGAPVHVLITPRERLPVDWAESTYAIRLLIANGQGASEANHLHRIYPRMLGPKLWMTTAAKEQGPALLRARPHLAEQAALFIRRYLQPAKVTTPTD